MSDAAVPQIGDNEPASPVLEKLREDYSKELARAQELTIAFSRAPTEIGDDHSGEGVVSAEEVAGKMGDFVQQFTAVIKSAEAAHKKEKEPYLTSGRTVDNFFKVNLIEPMKKLKAALVKRITVYERAKANEEKRIREAAEKEAREAAEEAARKAAEAEAAMETDAEVDDALVKAEEAAAAQEAAAEAAAKASATNAELSRTRGQRGSVASLRTEWKGDLIDRDKLDLEALRQHIPEDALKKAINAFVKAGGRGNLGGGAHIREVDSAVVR